MCVTFTPANPTQIHRLTGREVDFDYPRDAYPGYVAPLVIKRDGAANTNNAGDGGRDEMRADEVSVLPAVFGLIPAWAKDRNFAKRTYNARSETVAEKPSYRSAWRERRFCLVPMERFYEPCWETGKAVRWSIHRQDNNPFAVAAIWERWTDKQSGEIVTSFSMLTINGDGHAVMGRFHRPGDERRSLVVVELADWRAWLDADDAQARALLQPINVQEFTAEPAPAAKPATRTNSKPDQSSLCSQ